MLGEKRGTAIELLESLNLLDEQERIEAKRASEAGKSILETVCAFANEPGMGGGWLALGVVREELALFPAYEVEGITNPEKIASEIANQCRDVFNIPLRVDISTENGREWVPDPDHRFDTVELRDPLFRLIRRAQATILDDLPKSFLGEEDIAWLAQFRELHLSDGEAKALIVVREAGAIDNATYRELNKVDALTASGALRRLRDAGLLAQKGRGSATYYVPIERIGSDGRGLPTKPAALSANPQGLSTNPEALSDTPEDLPTTTTPEEETARRTLLAELPGDLAAKVGALGRRSIPNQTQAVIVEVCRLRAWRPEELALLLQRNARHVRTYLRPPAEIARSILSPVMQVAR